MRKCRGAELTSRYSSSSVNSAGSMSSAAVSAERWLTAASAAVSAWSHSTRTGLCIRPATYKEFQWLRSSSSTPRLTTPYLRSRPEETRAYGLK